MRCKATRVADRFAIPAELLLALARIGWSSFEVDPGGFGIGVLGEGFDAFVPSAEA